MKVQRKSVTHDQMMKFCDKYPCFDCPMALHFMGLCLDCGDILKMEQAIKDHLNEKVEVENEDSN